MTTYMGVRVSQREAELLKLLDEARERQYVLPPRLKAKCEAVEQAVQRVLSYEKGDMLVDRRADPVRTLRAMGVFR